MDNNIFKKNKGFTLIELLITIFIIAIILTVATISFSEIRKNSRDNQRVQDIQQIQLVLEKYYQDNDSYPNEIIFGESLVNEEKEKIYLSKIPQNPSPRSDESCSESEYIYEINNDNYSIEFCLGKETGKISAGYNCATPQGIRAGKCFQCGMSITYEEKNYRTTLIGSQCWFIDNLNIGQMLCEENPGNTSCATNSTDNSIIEKYCYNNLESNCDIYGGLYNLEEALQYNEIEPIRGICPEGWHIPSEDEYNTLISYIGTDPARKLKSCRQANGVNSITNCSYCFSDETCPTETHPRWDYDGSNYGNNEYNFYSLPGGTLTSADTFTSIGYASSFWSSLISGTWGKRLTMTGGSSDVFLLLTSGAFGNSIRCLKNEE